MNSGLRDPNSALPPVAQMVRQGDRVRYVSALFAPEGRRPDLIALYAFDIEIIRIPRIASQNMIGEIRFQWWRDALEAIAAGHAPRGHEVLLALAPAVRSGTVEAAALIRMIDAHVHDLYDDPLADMSALLAYAGATGGDLAAQASRILGSLPGAHAPAEAPAEAVAVARDVGTAWALTGLLCTLGRQAGAGRCYMPADRLAAEGVQMADFLACRPSAGLARVVAEVAAEARRLLASARARRHDLPKAALPAVLMAPLVDRSLARLARTGADPFQPVELPPWQAPALIGLAALRGRF